MNTLHLAWTTMLAVGVSVLWLVFAIRSAFSSVRFPKQGWRRTEVQLAIGTGVLALAWIAQVDFRALLQTRQATTQASAVAAAPKTSCATLSAGMTAGDVRSRMGDPDETRSDEETRGPGTSILVYRSSRCAVHLFDDRVEFID